MKAAGIDTKARKYILLWRHKYILGEEPKCITVMEKLDGGERRRHLPKNRKLARSRKNKSSS